MANEPVDWLGFLLHSFNLFTGVIDNSLPGCELARE